MSEDSLKRIERTLEKLAARQAAILDRLERLEDANTAKPLREVESPRDRVIAFLDQFRAGEALGEASLGAWIHVCRDSALRGGLRVVQAREASHARLLAERVKELGGALLFEIPDATYEQVMAGSASTETSDAEKVAAFVTRFSDPDRAVAPIHAVADILDDDPETQSLLRTIAEDERATLAYFYAQKERLERGGGRDDPADPAD